MLALGLRADRACESQRRTVSVSKTAREAVSEFLLAFQSDRHSTQQGYSDLMTALGEAGFVILPKRPTAKMIDAVRYGITRTAKEQPVMTLRRSTVRWSTPLSRRVAPMVLTLAVTRSHLTTTKRRCYANSVRAVAVHGDLRAMAGEDLQDHWASGRRSSMKSPNVAARGKPLATLRQLCHLRQSERRKPWGMGRLDAMSSGPRAVLAKAAASIAWPPRAMG